MALALAIPLLISPVVFPWYLSALVPLLALRPNIYGIAACLIIMPLTYEVLNDFSCCGSLVSGRVASAFVNSSIPSGITAWVYGGYSLAGKKRLIMMLRKATQHRAN